MGIKPIHEQDEGIVVHLFEELFHPIREVVFVSSFILDRQVDKSPNRGYSYYCSDVLLHQSGLVNGDVLFKARPALALDRPHAKASLILENNLLSLLLCLLEDSEYFRTVIFKGLSCFFGYPLSLSDCLSLYFIL